MQFFFITKKKLWFFISITVISLIINSYIAILYINNWSDIVNKIITGSIETEIWVSFASLIFVYLSFKLLYILPLAYLREYIEKESEMYNYSIYVKADPNKYPFKSIIGRNSTDHYQIAWILTYGVHIISTIPEFVAIIFYLIDNILVATLSIIFYIIAIVSLSQLTTKLRNRILGKLIQADNLIKGRYPEFISKIREIKMAHKHDFLDEIVSAQDSRTRNISTYIAINGLIHPYTLQILLIAIVFVLTNLFSIVSLLTILSFVTIAIVMLPYITKVANAFYRSYPFVVKLSQDYRKFVTKINNEKEIINYDYIDEDYIFYKTNINNKMKKLDRENNIVWLLHNELSQNEDNLKNSISIFNSEQNVHQTRFQDSDLTFFNETLKFNICLEENVDDLLYYEVTQICKINFKDPLSKIYQGGANLSGGEKARINLARIVYKVLSKRENVSIIVAPFRGLDKKLEEEIFSKLTKLNAFFFFIVTEYPNYLIIKEKIV